MSKKDEHIKKIKELFWRFAEGEITQEEMESILRKMDVEYQKLYGHLEKQNDKPLPLFKGTDQDLNI